jgi:hypothetical protein
MADIAIQSPLGKRVLPGASFEANMKDALAKFGSIVVYSGTSSYADVATTTTAGAPAVAGVISSLGDPNNSGLFASGDNATVQTGGIAQVLVLGSTAFSRGDRIVTSTTAGVGKKWVNESVPFTVIGECLQDVTTGTNPQLVPVRLTLVTENH